MNTNRIKWYDQAPFPPWNTPLEDTEKRLLASIDRYKSDCLHDHCSSCHGSGNRNDGLGMCVHMISCPCKMCSPR